MIKYTILFVACLFLQVWALTPGSDYNPFLSYNHPYMRYPRRAQSVTDIPLKSNPAYDVTLPRRSQSVYDVNPPTRSQSQSVYDVNPPTRSQSQSVYDDNPPTRSQSQSVYDVNPPTRSQSQSVYDDNPPTRSQSQSVYAVNPPTRSQSQSVYDVNPPTRSQSQSVYAVNPPTRSQSQSVYDVNPPTRSQSQSVYDVNPPTRSQSQSVYDANPPTRSHSIFDGERHQDYVVIERIPIEQDSNIGSENLPAVPQKSASAYWVEPYRSNANVVAKGPPADVVAKGPPAGVVAKSPPADVVAKSTAIDAPGYEFNQGGTNPVSGSRVGSNVDNEPKCILPPLPEHGSYFKNDANPTLRLGSEIVTLNVSCDPGYILQGAATVHCYNGFWADDMPKCLPVTCPLKKHHSVEYRCLVIGDVVGSRECHAEEPVGTMVSPLCRKPLFYSTSNNLAFMHCGEDGTWDHVAKCTPECGTVTAKGHGLVVGGQNAKRGELPWHVAIYQKRFMPYMQICGGTLISNKLIISAAHCFWDDIQKQLPASDFALAVGKLYRPYEDMMDNSQKTDVKEIHIPPRFQGASSNFQDDIAMVIPVDAFEYKIYVRPVCLSFDSHFDRLQLQTVNKGKVAGWGLTAADGKPSPVLQVLELPYVEVGTCIQNSPHTFVAHITSDKICAGDRNTTTALCRGDSGGGLTFVATDRDTPRYYLRGIVSTAPSDEHECNTHTYTSFTHVQKHEDFIKQFITEA